MILSGFRTRIRRGKRRKCSGAGGRRMREAGGIARIAAVRAGGGGKEFPDSIARASVDLGRPGSADDPERRGSTMVERDAAATALRRDAYGVCGNASCRERAGCGTPARGDGDALCPPVRLKRVEALLASGDVKTAEDNVVPSEMYLLAEEMAAKDQATPLAADLRKLAAEAPAELSQRAISRGFGTRSRRWRIRISRSC